MGLNWAEGFKQTGIGLKGLQDAKEKTLELEYRNTRDANLRRFQLEDQARGDRLIDEKRTYDEGVQAEKDIRDDEKSGISPGTERGQSFIDKEEKDRANKQTDAMERIRASVAGRYKSKNKELTKAEYIDRGMQAMEKQWMESIEITDATEGNRMMPKFEKDMWRKAFANDWESLQTEAGKTPFSKNEEEDGFDPNDPAGLKDLLPDL